MNLDSHKLFISSLGGKPVSLAWSELYGALQAGVVDGQMNPIPIIRFGRFDEVQKYVTLTNPLLRTYVWVINQAFWNSLELNEKSAVENAARSAIVAGRGLNRIIEASDRGLAVLKQRMDVYVPTESELKPFRNAVQPAFKEHIQKAFGDDGTRILDDLLAAIANR